MALFFTFSAADLNWPDHLHIVGGPANSDPGLSVWYIQYRFRRFFETIFIPMLKIRHYWYRMEFQSRGTPHFHGLAQCADAPNLFELAETDPNLIIQWIENALQLTAMHPYPERIEFDAQNPLKKDYRTIADRDADYCHIINTCQLHHCTESYCLRKQRGSGTKKCRFGFPKETTDETKIVIDPKGRFVVYLKRNHDRLNIHIRSLLQIWRANIDIQIIIDPEISRKYVSKYASKAERASESFTQILQRIVMKMVGGHEPSPDQELQPIRLWHRLLNKTMIDRDYSSQEVCWLALGGQLVWSSVGDNFYPIYLDGSVAIDRGLQLRSSIAQAYQQRSLEHAEMSLYEYVAKVFGVTPTHRIAIPKAVPNRLCNPDDPETFQKYCKDMLTLHHPWSRSPEEVLFIIRPRSRLPCTWTEKFYDFLAGTAEHQPPKCLVRAVAAFRRRKAHMEAQDPDNHSESDANTISDEDVAENETLRNDADHDHAQPDDIVYAQLYDDIASSIPLASQAVEYYYGDDNYAWDKFALDNPNYAEELVQTWNELRNQAPADVEPNILPRSLSGHQRLVFAIIADHYSNRRRPPLRLIVSGRAGTGKTQVIKAICGYLPPGTIAICAPSGVAAYNVGGSTIHSLLKLPLRGDTVPEPSAEVLVALQRALHGVKYLFIDERSFIGQGLFYMINVRYLTILASDAFEVVICHTDEICVRLQQVLPGGDSFGGLSVVLFGDDGQLPPVKDSPLYAKPSLTIKSTVAYALYHSFTDVVELTTVFRQHDVEFKNCLERIRDYSPIEPDFDLLRRRLSLRLGEDVYQQFKGAPHLFARKLSVEEHNCRALASPTYDSDGNRIPVARIHAIHVGARNASTVSSDQASGLPAKLLLRIGARVMLRMNLALHKGLVNGAMGTVSAIIYDPGVKPPELPFCIRVQFDHLQTIVPIFKHRACFMLDGTECIRTQFPLSLAWAITIHKYVPHSLS